MFKSHGFHERHQSGCVFKNESSRDKLLPPPSPAHPPRADIGLSQVARVFSYPSPGAPMSTGELENPPGWSTSSTLTPTLFLPSWRPGDLRSPKEAVSRSSWGLSLLVGGHFFYLVAFRGSRCHGKPSSGVRQTWI